MKITSLLIVLFLFSCNKTQNISQNEAQPKAADSFKLKMQCSEFLSKLEAKLKKENDEAYQYSNSSFRKSHKGSLTVKELDFVCYSEKFNTCVSLVLSKVWALDGHGLPSELLSQTADLVDLLSDKQLGISSTKYIKSKMTNPDYTEQLLKLIDSTKCL